MDAVQPLLRELLGHAMRRERHAQGMTLAQVASRSGVSIQHLSDVERGRKDPSSEVLAAITGALGLSVTDLAARIVRSATGQHEMVSPVPAGPAGTRSRRDLDLVTGGHRTPHTHVPAGFTAAVTEAADLTSSVTEAAVLTSSLTEGADLISSGTEGAGLTAAVSDAPSARATLPVDSPVTSSAPSDARIVLDLTRARRRASSQHPTQVPSGAQAPAQVIALTGTGPHSGSDVLALARPEMVDQSQAPLAPYPLTGRPLTGPLLAAA